MVAAADALYEQITVEDNGIGISQTDYTTIFGLFSRLHGRKQFEGTGIGLATTRKAVDNHNGAITLDSKVGVGTTFHVYLPMKGQL